ncbi:MAG: hypothetical protein JWR34_739 [Mycobacterium sp.]|nr:hypothetical protein [Mycobacterium sp.]
MSPRDELLVNRALGQEGAVLLYRTVWLVAVGNGFPAPAGGPDWNEDAVVETAHDFVDGPRGAKRLLDIAVRSVDDRSFARLLEASVRNFLRDIGRRTDFGKVVLRVKELLRDEDAFEKMPADADRWTLTGGPTAPSTAHPDALTLAIRDMPVTLPRWSSDHRTAPLADRTTLVALMVTILRAASGSLTAIDICHALVSRLDHRRTALSVDLDVRRSVSEPPDSRSGPADQTLASLHAHDIFESLSDREKIIVTVLEKNVRELGRMIGTGKTQAAILRQQLIDRLSTELAYDEDPDLTAAALCRECEEWVDYRTDELSATSFDSRADRKG